MDNFFCVVSGRKSAATAQFFVANQWQHGANFVANHGQAWLIYKKTRGLHVNFRVGKGNV